MAVVYVYSTKWPCYIYIPNGRVPWLSLKMRLAKIHSESDLRKRNRTLNFTPSRSVPWLSLAHGGFLSHMVAFSRTWWVRLTNSLARPAGIRGCSVLHL